MLGHFLQSPQGGMNMYLQKFWIESQEKAGGLLNFDHEQVYLFNAMLKNSASAKKRRGSWLQLLGNIGEKIEKIGKSRQTLKNRKYMHFF